VQLGRGLWYGKQGWSLDIRILARRRNNFGSWRILRGVRGFIDRFLAGRLARRNRREQAKRDADAQDEHRKRQLHYRNVTHSDATGKDTRDQG
jgi:hypothetical protein